MKSKKKSNRGRKTKLSSEVQEKICQALRAGNTRRTSALYAGISEQTFYNWLNAGREANRGQYFEFVEAVTRAEAECEVWHVANVKKHAGGDWRASIEWLKRRKPEEWGNTEKVDMSVQVEKQVVTVNGVDIEF